MLTSLGFAGLLGILGTFAAVLWTILVRAAGTPAFALASVSTRYGRPGLVRAGTVLGLVVESYVVLAFGGLTSRFVLGTLHSRPGLSAWPLWLVGWYLAMAPVLFAGRDVPGTQVRDEQDVASGIALALTAVAYWVFVLWPNVLAVGWPWLPGVAI
jgi:hypothetical protein